MREKRPHPPFGHLLPHAGEGFTSRGISFSDLVVSENWFSVSMGLDATFKGMGRVAMKEICVYRVHDGKIVREQFFYDAG